jgi:carboxy-cis,cis-muconate cyclase
MNRASSSIQHALQASAASAGTCPRVRHLISGTFNSSFLHILSFDTLTRTLSLLSTLPAYGPHSFLTQGRTVQALQSGRLVDTLYATTWAPTTELCAWKLQWNGDKLDGLQWLGNVPITATSSYVHIQPPPYDSVTTPSYGVGSGASKYLYSAGGPTGEVHSIDTSTGSFVDRRQEIVFLRGGRKDLAAADKTRKALRYGAHNVDISVKKIAYIADVGRNSILAYQQDSESGQLTLLSETYMPVDGDGPRHVVPSPCGRFAYGVTEHTSYVDVFAVQADTRPLRHVQRVSILADGVDVHRYRGDTVRLSPDARFLFATTRGMHAGTNGFVKVWKIDTEALERSITDHSSNMILHELVVYETRTSGGKANAVEFAPRYADVQSSLDYAVLTDDEQGYITVLEWDGTDLRDAATVQLPALEDGQAQGASQAVWVS